MVNYYSLAQRLKTNSGVLCWRRHLLSTFILAIYDAPIGDFRLYGCYENLVGGHLSDALQDVSGGVAETISVGKFLKNVRKQ